MDSMDRTGHRHAGGGRMYSSVGQLPLARSVRAEALGVTATLRICCFHSAEDPYWTSQCSGSLAEVETAIGTLGAHGRTYHCSRSRAQVQCSSSAVNKAQQQAGLVDSKYEGIHLLQIMGNDAEVAETAPWTDSGATSSGCAGVIMWSWSRTAVDAPRQDPRRPRRKRARALWHAAAMHGTWGPRENGDEAEDVWCFGMRQSREGDAVGRAIVPCWRQEYEVERAGKAERLVSELGNSGQRKWILDKVESRRDRKVTPRQDP
ncbi:hypothetical protein B0H21DRAFT_713576 [Amylocystis lapponica]|nr:hypothetical protein B0H21DRAFT_713576 [Amylocystis lapponica]